MGFKASHVTTDNKEDVQRIPNEATQDLELTKTEIEVLLKTIADATIKGRDIELFYNLVIKLQEMYLKR